MCVRLKKNGTDIKEIPLIGKGIQNYIDNLFWYLPFSSVSQAAEMLEMKEMSDKHWVTKRDEVKAEHLLERALADLRMGQKAWIAEHWSGKEGAGAAAVIPAAEIT